jgi:biopolymer transport protein ExbD
MGLKKRTKVATEFNMSSLTDIIFLLLIFFMLTSSLVTPNALNLQLPGKKSDKTIVSNKRPAQVDILSNGALYLNNKSISLETLEQQLIQFKQRNGNEAVASVSPEADAINDDIVAVLDILYRLEIKASLQDPK